MNTDCPRFIADVRGSRQGPTLVVTAGLHGNEPAGVLAARMVAEALAPRARTLKGRFVALTGNRAALARGVRFIERDLNRDWDEPNIEHLLERPPSGLANEDKEQRELLDIQRALARESARPLTFVDLHSTSGSSEPFVCFGDTLRNRSLSLALPVTAILGLEEVISGAMLGYWADHGHAAIAFEGGQHEEPATVERDVAVLWLCLVNRGLLAAAEVPNFESHRASLREASRGRPRVVEIVHRHFVAEGSDFEMLPGFSSFTPVRVGQPLAREHGRLVVSVKDALLLMPRYQGQGEDGFFLVRPVAPIWLKISELLRRGSAHRALHLLPGVVPASGHALEVKIAPGSVFRHTVNLMHLLGYRRQQAQGEWLVFSRRPFD